MCLGLFVALDLILFFLFFDLSIVSCTSSSPGWGHGERARAAALKFFLYTFLGSLALLLGFIVLYLAAEPHTFDIVELPPQNPLAGGGPLRRARAARDRGRPRGEDADRAVPHLAAARAHRGARRRLGDPRRGAAEDGHVRVRPDRDADAARRLAPVRLVVVVVGVVSVLYGALVALAQTDLKRMIAYTSVNHMGYVDARRSAPPGSLAGTDEQARQLATTGAVTQMVAHGLITGALFLLAGVLYDRGAHLRHGRLLRARRPAPRCSPALFAVAAFASLGPARVLRVHRRVPDLHRQRSAAAPVATAIAVAGILVTAGAVPARAAAGVPRAAARCRTRPGTPRPFADLRASEAAAIVPLLVLATVIGLLPRFLLDVIEPRRRGALVELVARMIAR